jgi:lipopolysaccharide export system ATP-binding protein
MTKVEDGAENGIAPARGRLLVSGLVKRYGKRTVVNGVSFHVDRGEVVGLLGPNGAGKSTSFKMVSGLVRPDAGTVHLDEDELTGMPLHRRARAGLGYLPQEPSVFRRMSVADNLMAVLELYERDLEQRKARMEALIQDFDLGHVRDSLGESLSGGERRRCEIARALVPQPTHLLFDEPFAGVDPIAVSEIQHNIQRLAKEQNIGVLITDHAVRETLGICERATVIDHGQVLVTGSPEKIAADPTARRIYLGEDFKLEA